MELLGDVDVLENGKKLLFRFQETLAFEAQLVGGGGLVFLPWIFWMWITFPETEVQLPSGPSQGGKETRAVELVIIPRCRAR